MIDPATTEGAHTWLSHSGTALFEAVATNAISCDRTGEPWLQERFKIVDGFLTSDGLPSRDARTRQRLGQPLIPGSAWKGIIRSRTEFILRSRYGESAACRQQPGCGNCPVCPVCAVFGHPGQRGLLAFRDSYIEKPAYYPKRTQVGIDRVTGGSKHCCSLPRPSPTGTCCNFRSTPSGRSRPGWATRSAMYCATSAMA